MRAGERVLEPRDLEAVASLHAGERDMIRADGAEPRGVEHVRERQTRVVRRGVEVAYATPQLFWVELWLILQYGARAQPAVTLHVPEQREQIVQRQPGRELPYRHPLALVDRPRECQRLDELRREPQQTPSLGARLEDEMQVAVLEISHSAVDEAR